MNQSEPQKLIAGFLLLAVVVTSSALLLFNATTPAKVGSMVSVSGTTAVTTPTNAFQEPIPTDAPLGQANALQSPPENLLLSDTLGTTAATNTLTARLIIALGAEFGKTNPSGPIMANGEPGLVPPDPDNLIASLLQDPALANIQIPDWEGDIVFRFRPNVVAGAHPADVATYKKAIADFYRTYFIDGAPASDPTSLTALDPSVFRTQEALVAAQSIPVPEPFAKLQWNLIKVIAYQDKAIQLTRTADTDPVGASVIMGAQEDRFAAALQELDQESRKAAALGLVLPSIGTERSDWLATAAWGVLGIKTAHAQFAVNDLVKLAREIWTYAKKVLTEKLKDLLVHKLVQQTITWIQGGGKPQFITNWKGFLLDTGKTGAALMIDTVAPGLCTSFAPLIKIAVLPVDPSRDFDALPSCTIDRLVSNVKDFANSFESGGWVAYGAAMEPSNNLIGSLIQTRAIIINQTAEAEEAKQADVKAGKGFTPQQECVKEGDSEYATCLSNAYDACADARMTVDECDDMVHEYCDGKSNADKCLEWRDTTPGSMLYDSINDSTRASLERVVNAKDFIALINTLINAALSKLTKMGTTVVSKGLTNLSLGDSSTYVAPPQGGGGGQNNPEVTMPNIPDLDTSSTPPGTGTASYQSAINAAVASVIASDAGALFDKADVDPYGNIRVNVGQGTAYYNAVVAALQAAGYVAVNAYSEEIALRRAADSFDENYDIMLTHSDGSEYTRPPKFMGSNSPPADTAGL